MWRERGTASSADDLRHDEEEVGVRGALAQRRDEGMGLTAMMRLVIEEMRDQQAARQRDLALRRAAEPGQALIEPGLGDAPPPAFDCLIRRVSKALQLREILDPQRALLQAALRLFPIGEARHPLAVAPEDMRQGLVQRAPEGAALFLALRIREPRGG